MNYYGGGPDWAMIGARRRAEREASAARSQAGSWKARAEALAALVYETADRRCPTHTGGDCQCRGCWERRVGEIFGTRPRAEARPSPDAGPHAGFWDLVNKISQEAEKRRGTP
ncbi:hypothetical protein GTZ89_44515 [Streptomyces sp. SID8382]|uniref:hypothetical protein n=1 Tax=Streptomyces malaysiensis TaxID=92644 RepID=UPI000C2C7AEA|nr:MULTISPECIES: hypothetical protein [unclassified Streptomyces]AUA07963.1 hypothetical protein CFP59_00048 [Streptomyces sp. M56]MYX62483.1 hypothetical protein [Streptomyces sp. SID8382]